MTSRSIPPSWARIVPSSWTHDLVAVALLVVLADASLVLPAVPWPVEWALGVPLLLILPGYALLQAAFPTDPGDGSGPLAERSPSWPARLALSLVVSPVTVAVLAVPLTAFSALTRASAVGSLSLLTLLAVALAAARRAELSPSVRADPSLDALGLDGRPFAFGTGFQTMAAGVALLVLVASLAYAGAAPPAGEPYTEFYVATEEPDGDLVASGFPTTVTAGSEVPLSLVVENRERRETTYTLVVLAQTVGPNGSVVAEERLAIHDRRLAPGGSAVVNTSVAPTLTGEEVRLQFLLYRGPTPDDPSAENADLSLRLWVTVTPGEDA